MPTPQRAVSIYTLRAVKILDTVNKYNKDWDKRALEFSMAGRNPYEYLEDPGEEAIKIVANMLREFNIE